jgi:hypothetical protein
MLLALGQVSLKKNLDPDILIKIKLQVIITKCQGRYVKPNNILHITPTPTNLKKCSGTNILCNINKSTEKRIDVYSILPYTHYTFSMTITLQHIRFLLFCKIQNSEINDM